MNFYPQQHHPSCGLDLQARARDVGILDQHGTQLVPKNWPTPPEAFFRLIAPYREDWGVGVGGLCSWSG